jgi:hypothetical protein
MARDGVAGASAAEENASIGADAHLICKDAEERAEPRAAFEALKRPVHRLRAALIREDV